MVDQFVFDISVVLEDVGGQKRRLLREPRRLDPEPVPVGKNCTTKGLPERISDSPVNEAPCGQAANALPHQPRFNRRLLRSLL